MAEKEYENIRGKDRKKLDIQWVCPQVIKEFPDTPKELKLCRIFDPTDLALLGRLEAHCAGNHWVWASEEQIWHFLTLLDKDNVPHCTIHCKDVEWRTKAHPRDTMPKIPFRIRKLVSNSCGYATWDDVVASAKQQGVEVPEKGSYGPMMYDSNTYGNHFHPKFPNSVMVDGKEVAVLSVSGKGVNFYGEENGGKYGPYVQEWYDEYKTENVLDNNGIFLAW